VASRTINCGTCSSSGGRPDPRWGYVHAPRPGDPGQQAADGGEQGTVGGLQPGSWNLTAEHGQLVAQHQDLQVLGRVAARAQGK
jgi:hypothetical protein